MNAAAPLVLLSAGDASGDLHAAALVKAMRAQRPQARFAGLGGPEMARAGVRLAAPPHALAAGGLFELAREVGRIAGAWFRMQKLLRQKPPPQLAVLVDAPDFNIPLAKHLRRRGVPVFYYISPQVWAWRAGRVTKIARRVNCLATIFPFEAAAYAGTNLRVQFVGHPLAERMAEFKAQHSRAECRAQLGRELELELGLEGRRLVALLPGSRRNEVRHSLPLQLAAARELARRMPETAFAIALAPGIQRETVAEIVAAHSAAAAAPSPSPSPKIISGRTYQTLYAADAALLKPGTATVEAALLQTPMAAAARANRLTAALIRRWVRVQSFTMPNLIAGAEVVPEFLQEQAAPEKIAAALQHLLSTEGAKAQRAALAKVCAQLAAGGESASVRAAKLAWELPDEFGSPAP